MRRRRGMQPVRGVREHVGPDIPPQDDGSSRVVVVVAREEHLNPGGTIHRGVPATVVDVAMGTAVVSTCGESPVTVSFTVIYLEPGSRLRACH